MQVVWKSQLLQVPGLILIPDGLDTWGTRQPLPHWRQLPAQQLIRVIHRAGIVGLGGGGFATAGKLQHARDQGIHLLIINGVECEPFATADDRLMQEQAQEVVSGAIMAAALTGARQCIFAIGQDKPQAMAAISAALHTPACDGGHCSLQVQATDTAYPAGSERQLLQIVTGKRLAPRALPTDAGALCLNPATCQAIHQAIVDGVPMTSRLITVTGDLLGRPGNYHALLGTPAAHLLKHAGLDQTRSAQIIMDGLMTGVLLPDAQVPVLASNNCLLAASRALLPLPKSAQPCIRCGACETVCPEQLAPQILHQHLQRRNLQAAAQQGLDHCIECAACSWVCPSGIDLVACYSDGKKAMRQQQEAQQRAQSARLRFTRHKQRQSRLRQQQQARHLASRDETPARRAQVLADALVRGRNKPAAQNGKDRKGVGNRADHPDHQH